MCFESVFLGRAQSTAVSMIVHRVWQALQLFESVISTQPKWAHFSLMLTPAMHVLLFALARVAVRVCRRRAP